MDSQPRQAIAAFQRLDIYTASRDLAKAVHLVRITDAELKDQARRASKSVFLNLCEGLPSYSVPMRRKYFNSAYGSVCELAGALDLLRAISTIDAAECEAIEHLANRVAVLLRALKR